jgi:hypothetical protein
VTSIPNASYTLTLRFFNIRGVIIWFGQSPTLFTKNKIAYYDSGFVCLVHTGKWTSYTKKNKDSYRILKNIFNAKVVMRNLTGESHISRNLFILHSQHCELFQNRLNFHLLLRHEKA